jgi:ATP-dependent DNA ligase
MLMLVFKPTTHMANKTILMTRIRQILRLYTQGKSKKQISQLTSSSRNTVKKYIHKFILEHLTYDVVNEMSDHDLDLLFGYTEPAVKDERFEAQGNDHNLIMGTVSKHLPSGLCYYSIL